MPNPRKKHTKRKRGQRRAHLKLIKLVLISCPHCKKPILPHRVCLYCGWYKGREVIKIKIKKGKKEKDKKAKKEKK